MTFSFQFKSTQLSSQ